MINNLPAMTFFYVLTQALPGPAVAFDAPPVPKKAYTVTYIDEQFSGTYSGGKLSSDGLGHIVIGNKNSQISLEDYVKQIALYQQKGSTSVFSRAMSDKNSNLDGVRFDEQLFLWFRKEQGERTSVIDSLWKKSHGDSYEKNADEVVDGHICRCYVNKSDYYPLGKTIEKNYFDKVGGYLVRQDLTSALNGRRVLRLSTASTEALPARAFQLPYSEPSQFDLATGEKPRPNELSRDGRAPINELSPTQSAFERYMQTRSVRPPQR